MNKFLKNWFWTLILIGFTPAVITALWNQIHISTPLKATALIAIAALIALSRFGMGWLFNGLWKAISGFFIWLFFANRRWEGARYMDPMAAWLFFRSSQKGWLIDGRSKRVSERVSYMSMLTVGGMGTGKTTGFVFPNLERLDNRSFVITDMSGEIYDRTAASLRRRGFDIRVLDLMDLPASQGYNPLANAQTFTEIQQVANLIIRSSPSAQGNQDPFWNSGAEKLLRVFIQCLKNNGVPQECNLGRVKELISQFDSHRAPAGQSQTDNFVMQATLNDPNTWNEYRGLIGGNERTLLSFLTTADTALTALANPEIINLTSRHEIDFAGLRQRKTALFIKARQQDVGFFSFLLNCFYTDLFRSLLGDVNVDGLPVYLLLDEFGQLNIPDFAVFATTARKYRVAFWIFLQSLGQLETRYGHNEARTIVDGIGTEIFLAGQSLETAERLSRRAGAKRQRYHVSKQDNRIPQSEINLLNPDEVISIKADEALLFHRNKRPYRFRIYRSY